MFLCRTPGGTQVIHIKLTFSEMVLEVVSNERFVIPLHFFSGVPQSQCNYLCRGAGHDYPGEVLYVPAGLVTLPHEPKMTDQEFVMILILLIYDLLPILI